MPWNLPALTEKATERLLERGALGVISTVLFGFIYLVYRDATLTFIPETVAIIQAGYERQAEKHRLAIAERDLALERLLAAQERLTREVMEEMRRRREIGQ